MNPRHRSPLAIRYSLFLLFLSALQPFSLSALCADAPASAPERLWQGIPGLERTEKGRLFFTWFTGGTMEPEERNMAVLCYSDDNGKTHSPLQVLGAPLKDGTRCYDPAPWIDPKGRLWYIFNRSNKTTGRHGVYARICDAPDAPVPAFGPEFKIELGVPYSLNMNKPTVLSTGEWLLPVTFVHKPVYDWTPGKGNDKQPRLHGVAISKDGGKSWKLRGEVLAKPLPLENMITELKDGRLWMLVRSISGFLFESYSTDKGETWSEGMRSEIANPGSRFFIRRLASGNLLLVNHVGFDAGDTNSEKRNNLTAQISTDDGKTWGKPLMLDARKPVSYPDGVQDKTGLIWIVYDYDRVGIYDKESPGYGSILMAKFREEDVVQGKNASGDLVLRQLIDRIDSKMKEKRKKERAAQKKQEAAK